MTSLFRNFFNMNIIIWRGFESQTSSDSNFGLSRIEQGE
jgi:hypothetical protein